MATRVLFFLLVSVALQSNLLFAIIVADTECPNDPNSRFIAPCNTVSYSCERIDSGISQVNPGIFDTVTGGVLDCENCDPQCPEKTPEAQICTKSLEVSYEEVVTVSLAQGVSASAGAGVVSVEQSLEMSIGHSNARTITRNVTCGAPSLSGCKMQSFAATLTITKNIKTKMDHTYRWVISIGHDSSKCTIPADHRGPYPETSHENAGTRTSTASGSSYGAAASCKTTSSADCPSG